jgi:hypothetical protein
MADVNRPSFGFSRRTLVVIVVALLLSALIFGLGDYFWNW